MIGKAKITELGSINMNNLDGLDPEEIEDSITQHLGQRIFVATCDAFSGLLKDMMESFDDDGVSPPDNQVLFSVNFYLNDDEIIAYSKGYDG